MARYQLLIEYVGTNFRGWQIQKKGLTIQGLIQEKLTKLLKQKIVLNGSGRTDTGVHAIEQSAHFDCKDDILDLTKFLKSINHFLNDNGIAITKIRKRSNKFHSRFSAKQRVYRYIIFNQISEPVIEKKRGWHVRKPLDLDLIKRVQKNWKVLTIIQLLELQVVMLKVQLKQLSQLKLNRLKIESKLNLNHNLFYNNK